MAATNKTAIKLYGSNTASAVPSGANLANDADGIEIAVNAADKRLFAKNGSGTVVELGTNPSALAIPASGVTGTLTVPNGGTGAATLTGVVKGNGTSAFTAATAGTDYVAPDTATNFTAPQRSALLTDNDGSFDLSAKQNFKCTPTGAVALTFTNHADGLSGSVLFINGANYAITAAATTKISASALSRLSATGTYRIDFIDDGTNAYCTVSENLA